MGVGGQRHSPAALPSGMRPGTHRTGGWVDPRASIDGCGKSRTHRDSIPGPSSPTVSLYRLRYPGPLITKAKLWLQITCTGKKPYSWVLTVIEIIFLNFKFRIPSKGKTYYKSWHDNFCSIGGGGRYYSNLLWAKKKCSWAGTTR